MANHTIYGTIESLQQEVEQLQAEKIELIKQHNAELEQIATQKSTIEQVQIELAQHEQTEHKMRKALEEEQELNELKSRFVCMTSHEFRTPLAKILSSTELLQHYNHKWTEQKKQVHFERICSTVQHMTEMLDDILFWSKIDDRRLRLNPSWLNITSFCSNLVEELQQSEGKKHNVIFQCLSQDTVQEQQLLGANCCRLNYEDSSPYATASLISNPVEYLNLGEKKAEGNHHSLSEDKIIPMYHNGAESTSAVAVAELPQWLVCLDEKLLRQILINLLSNAIKYSPVSSTIKLEVAFEGENLIFQIQDSGIGIPPETLQHLFESFHRGDNVGNIPGTGLGLAIVKKSIDLHDGQITVDSKVGTGTTFTVTIPVSGSPVELSPSRREALVTS